MKRIGRFELIQKLGEGAMGKVYRAMDPLIERTVAIKTIPLALPEAEKKLFEDRFFREAKSAGKLSHPNIVTIYDVGETQDFAYIAMEYLDGPSLRDVLHEHGALPLELALDTARQMADALAFAHDHGVVHRDVKPPNVIVVGKRGTVKLTDFGIAHLMNHAETQAGTLVGSPRYMSPEQVQGQPVDGRSDIFSLGVVLYEMLAGHPPFGGDELHGILFRIVNEPAPLVSRQRTDVPADVDAILARCLAKQPRDRYASAHELARDLARLLEARKTELAEAAAKSALPRSLKVVAFGMPLLVALVLAVGLIVITFILERNRPPAGAAAPSIQTPQLVNIATSLSRAKPGDAQPPATTAATNAAGKKDFYLDELERKLAKLKVERAELLSTYTALHPDVVLLDRQIGTLEVEKRAYLRRKQRQNK
jgi:serine/threonine-protein kinase